jgi:WD40 repeat protein
VAFSDEGRTLAAGGADGSVNVLRTSDGMTTALLRAPFAPRSIAFAPESDDIVVVSADGRTSEWVRGVRHDRPAGERAVAPAWNVTLSSGARRVAAGGMDGTARVHDGDGAWLRDFEHGAAIRSLAFSSDGSMLATGGTDGRARLWSVATAEIGVLP